MFKALTGIQNCFSIKVGSDASYARFNLHNPQMVVSLLEAIHHVRVPAMQ